MHIKKRSDPSPYSKAYNISRTQMNNLKDSKFPPKPEAAAAVSKRWKR